MRSVQHENIMKLGEYLNRPQIIASASLYSADCRALENALAAGREFARKHGRVFEGMKLDIDGDGFVHVHIIGVDSFKL